MRGLESNLLRAGILLGAFAIILNAGCGGMHRVGQVDNPEATSSPAAPSPAPTASPSATPAPTPSPTPLPTPTPTLQISKKDFQTQPLGWFAKPYIDVVVSNFSAVTLSGTVHVQFTTRGSNTGDPQTKPVTLKSGETVTPRFVATTGNPDSATYSVSIEPAVDPLPTSVR